MSTENAADRRSSANDSYVALSGVRDRLCRLMFWEPSSSHKFEIIRRTMAGDAIALSVKKAEQLAARIEALEGFVRDVAECECADNWQRGEPCVCDRCRLLFRLRCDGCDRLENPPFDVDDRCVCGGQFVAT